MQSKVEATEAEEAEFAALLAAEASDKASEAETQREPRRLVVVPGKSLDNAVKALEDVATGDLVAALLARPGWVDALPGKGTATLDYSMTQRVMLIRVHVGSVEDTPGERRTPVKDENGKPIFDIIDGKPVKRETVEEYETHRLGSHAGSGSGMSTRYAVMPCERLARAGRKAGLIVRVNCPEGEAASAKTGSAKPVKVVEV